MGRIWTAFRRGSHSSSRINPEMSQLSGHINLNIRRISTPGTPHINISKYLIIRDISPSVTLIRGIYIPSYPPWLPQNIRDTGVNIRDVVLLWS